MSVEFGLAMCHNLKDHDIIEFVHLNVPFVILYGHFKLGFTETRKWESSYNFNILLIKLTKGHGTQS